MTYKSWKMVSAVSVWHCGALKTESDDVKFWDFIGQGSHMDTTQNTLKSANTIKMLTEM